MTNFFNELKPISDFLKFADQNYYKKAPDDYLVVITDVEGSTKAIEAGKYKFVNMAGVSSIVALVNALGTKDFPFVFGGDGATALVPESARPQIEKYLRSARKNAQEAFGLNLRIGLVPHRDLLKENAPVQVARYAMNSGPSIAFFQGTGLGLAEKWVKSGKYLIEDGETEESGKVLAGLSCRWAPLKNTQGLMLSIIVKPKAAGAAAEMKLQEIATEIHRIVNLDSRNTHPVKEKTFRAEKMMKAARAEATLQNVHPRWLGITKVIVQMVLVRILVKFKMNALGFNAPKYISSMVTHSDYRKYDEMLRMVIDCSKAMHTKIRTYLENERAAGTVYFGIYQSDSALMTCFLQSHDEGGHIHFVDGNDGGYALAAKELKAQIAQK